MLTTMQPLDSAERFARLRSILLDVGYTTDAVCARTGAASIYDFRSISEGRAAAGPGDGIDVLIRLFLDALPVDANLAERLLPSGALPLLEEFGAIRHAPTDAAVYEALLALYPTEGLHIASDLANALGRPGSEEAVYPAITGNTAEFLGGLPTTPCDSLLDLGSGTGIAALVAARDYARHAWAVDITERATWFAGFNARLNGIGNTTIVRGDVYEPVAGLTFDRIITHPPYMPADDDGVLVFRDGGEDGERITRRVIAGLPLHLRPGGRCYCRCMASDRHGAPLQDRVRGMLGSPESEFDVLVVAKVAWEPVRFYAPLLASGDMSGAAVERQLHALARLGITRLVLGSIVIERHAEPRHALTLRRDLAPGRDVEPAGIDWLLRSQQASVTPGYADWLLSARPVVSELARVRVEQRMIDGELRACACIATARDPFTFSLESSPGLSLLLAQCDGSRTVEQLLAATQDMGLLPRDTTPDDFGRLVQGLIAGCVLELPEFPLPPMRENPRGGSARPQ